MKYAKIFILIFGYMLLIIMPFVIFPKGALRDLPEVPAYQGNLKFSGDLAYSKLKDFVKANPQRYSGDKSGYSSADYVENEFKKLGLKTERQEFNCTGSVHMGAVAAAAQPGYKGDVKGNFLNDFLAYIKDSVGKPNKAVNVIAASPGRSDRVILVGAHRDNIPECGTGAYDNASGTISMLEIARVFSETEHEHTMIFVSFDAEESGIEGSDAYVRKLADASKTDLALIFDMSGWKDGNAAAIYNAATNQGSAPLWIYALQSSIPSEDGGGAISIGDFYTGRNSSLWWEYFRKRAFLMAFTDTQPFIKKGIPALGVISDTDRDGIKVDTALQESLIHSPKDTIENVGPAGFNATGRFAERFIRSVDLPGNFSKIKSKGLETRNYAILNGKVLYGVPVSLYWAFVTIIMLLIAFLAVKNEAVNKKAILKFMKREALWILGIAATSIALGYSIKLFGVGSPSIGKYLIIFLGFVFTYVLAMILFPVLRLVLGSKTDISQYDEYTGNQRLLLVATYIFMGIPMAFLFNPITSIVYLGIPLLVFSHVRYKMTVSRVLWSIATYMFFTIYPLSAFLLSQFLLGTTTLICPVLSILYFVSIISVTYIVSVPRRLYKRDIVSYVI